MDKKLIRNFSIIAHIDHGKSTLADRILELTGTIKKREMKEQFLDSMDIERERGITIKLNLIQLKYYSKNKKEYIFNLIDTPGHIDFTYEVSHSLAACEGAILVVDASQGVEAQTLTNLYLAINNNLSIIPVINKIDLQSSDPDRVKNEIKNLIGISKENIPLISSKNGINIEEVLEAIVNKIPAPLNANNNNPLQALIFDLYYDKYRGVIALICIKQGVINVGEKIKLMNTEATYKVAELWIKNTKEVKKYKLVAGEVGYLAANIKIIKNICVGDTITSFLNSAKKPLPGYKKIKPMVFCGLYPNNSIKYNNLKESLEKIQLSDSSFVYNLETSKSLGFGFHCGFLGLLHMNIIKERLEREYNLELIATAPSVIYHIYLINKNIIIVDNPSKLILKKQKIDRIEEPFVKIIIITPDKYIGSLMELCQKKRGIYINIEYINDNRRILIYEMPLNEIIFNFFDLLKSISNGYASLNYQFIGYRSNKLVKLDILLNNEIIDSLSIIVHKDFAYNRGKELCLKLKKNIQRQNFDIPIQAAINNKIIVRENIKAISKNVLSKCRGGDITRKKKLLYKQKKGKKRMKTIGSVQISQDIFIDILNLEN